MSYPMIQLKDCSRKIGSGATPKGGKNVYVDNGVALIRSQNVKNLEFDHSGLAYISDAAADKLKSVTVYSEDILLNITGDSVARVCRVPEDLLPARVNQHVAIIRTMQDKLDPDFLSYYLASPFMQSFMSQIANGKGASRNALTKDMIENFEVPCPDFALQKCIVGMLKPFDKLIENNRRQIALLEEAAQRLYKEWFVDLRFPGYETTPIIDGLPEGWRKGKLDEIVEFRRGKTITQQETLDGDVPVVAGGLKPAYYHARANTTSPVITVSGSGANAGFCRLYTTEIWASDCSFADSSMTDNLYFAYASIKVLSNGFRQYQRGSAQPHVYPKHVNALDVVIPDAVCLSAFNDAAKALCSQIGILNKRVSAACEARDRLLPKLMSGEIEVI